MIRPDPARRELCDGARASSVASRNSSRPVAAAAKLRRPLRDRVSPPLPKTWRGSRPPLGANQAVRPALADVGAALEVVSELRDRPRGLLRLAVSSIAESFLTGPTLAGFLADYPEVQLDVTISDETSDIVADGFDAGVRLGEVIEQDMIAVPVSGEQRQLVVGSPAYVRRHGTPAHPHDLAAHACIGWRPRPDVAPYRWEFTEHGRDFDVAVAPRVTTNDMRVMIRLACAGAGLTFGMEETFRPYLGQGELVAMLEPFLPPFPGFYLYYPGRRPQPPKLRALVDYLRSRRGLPRRAVSRNAQRAS